MTLTTVLDRIDADQDAALERLLALLRIPSISTDPAYAADCMRTAEILAEDLRNIGFDARVQATAGHPMVMAHCDGPGPHLLFYGHYDVQPVDPLELWDTPPFEPAVEDTPNGKVIRGRGSADDKGQLMTFIEACRAYMSETGALPCRVTIFLEGEEESGSPSLLPFLDEFAKELKADIALICDTNMFGADTPAIITRLRGLLGEEIVIKGPEKDLHSGYFGGIAANPARVLARILAGLHDETGRITVPGFYDGVPALDPAIAAQWDALDFDASAFLADVGLHTPAGEAGKTPLEMVWSEPTCEINGMISGYTGDGFKTVLPAQARVKISFRLVGEQDPQAIRVAFRDYVESCLPPDCTATFEGHGAAGASQMSTDHPAFEIARQALTDEWNREAAFVGVGGSIPVAGHFQSMLGMDVMLIGFGHDDDQIHSPNEKYDLTSFHKGTRSWARILHGFSGMK